MHLETRIPAVATAALLALVLGHATLIGQSAVVGRAVDTAGEPLPGVTVTAMPADGGALRRTTTTGEDGGYRFEMLPDGRYRLDFQLRGFATARRNHVLERGSRSSPSSRPCPVSMWWALHGRGER